MKYIYKPLTLFALLFVTLLNVNAQTTVSSIISSNQTWTAAGSPYIVSGNVLIENGVTVTVEPGVHIRTTGTRLRLIIDGTFIAIGNKDSVIVADSIGFEFTSKCTDYDPSTGNGSQFKYVLFRNEASGGSKTIDLKSKSMLVQNCKFINGYYNIYCYVSAYDTTDIIVDKTIFIGGGYGQGYMVYSSGSSRLQITDSYADNVGGLIIGQWTTIKNSTFKNFGYSSGIRQTRGNKLILECNKFQNFRYNFIDLTYPSTNAEIKIKENTFDTCDVLLRLRGGANYRPASLEIKKNNFLYFKQNSIQVSVGSNPGKADTIDMTQNYWGTTDSSKIELGIKDFKDDITIEGLIDFSGYLTSQIKTCSSGGGIGSGDSTGGNVAVTNLSTANINLFPNPASAQVEVNSNEKTIRHIKVYNLQGQTEFDTLCNANSYQLDVSSLLNGIYIIQVEGDGFVTRNKLIIKH